MDIRTLAVEPTSRLHLRDAADELIYADPEKTKPVVVVLYGPGSKQYARAQAKVSNRVVARLKKGAQSNQTAEQKAAENAEFLADCTVAFENLEYGNLQGEALSRAVYADESIGFIADQVTKFLGEWANFTKGSPRP